MRAMVLNRIVDLSECSNPLELQERPIPQPGRGEVLIKIATCGVCHTELDEIEGRTPPPAFPVILGHEVVGRVAVRGEKVSRLKKDQRIGVGWIHDACGRCEYCRSGNENLCPDFRATGRDANGGYAEYMTVPERFAFGIPERFSDAAAAPLLCAGAIGYRSLRLSKLEDGQILGLTGFGASAHLVLKMVRYQYPQTEVYVFARSEKERGFARQLGAVWAGDTTDRSPLLCHAIIDTTPVWKPVVEALKNLRPGGRLVINAIRKEDGDKEYLLQLEYPQHLWMEKEIKSVANVAGRDIADFLALAERISIQPEVTEYPLEEANTALMELKKGGIKGAKVLRIGK